MHKKITVSQMAMVGLFAAIIAAVTQISIPLPTGIPITLQTFIIPLCGLVLGWKLGTLSTIIYLFIGLLGAPVFSNLSGGPAALFGKTGGFLIGFIFFTLLAGLTIKIKNKYIKAAILFTGLAIDHFIGVLWFALLMNLSVTQTFAMVSMPYLLKDILSVVAAYMVSLALRKALSKSNIELIKA